MQQTSDLAKLRILELGDAHYFKLAYPERTTLVWTGARVLPKPDQLDATATPGAVLRALNDAKRGRYDVVVAYPPRYSPSNPRYWGKAFLQRPWRPWSALTRAHGASYLRYVELPVPLVLADWDDAFGLSRATISLMDRATLIFKRELPVDRWHVLYGGAHPHLPTLRFRLNEKWAARIGKLRPISLPQLSFDPALAHRPFPDKIADLFFAGSVRGNSTVRQDGLAEIERLRSRGVRVDIPERPLPVSEFRRRMAQAWLAWSPEGLGWDCNRHYEAALGQTVPVINYPTILRYAPLEEGVHAFHYAPEPGGLEAVVMRALANKERLRAMAIAARDHALAHHTVRAVCDHILASALAASRKGGG